MEVLIGLCVRWLGRLGQEARARVKETRGRRARRPSLWCLVVRKRQNGLFVWRWPRFYKMNRDRSALFLLGGLRPEINGGGGGAGSGLGRERERGARVGARARAAASRRGLLFFVFLGRAGGHDLWVRKGCVCVCVSAGKPEEGRGDSGRARVKRMLRNRGGGEELGAVVGVVAVVVARASDPSSNLSRARAGRRIKKRKPKRRRRPNDITPRRPRRRRHAPPPFWPPAPPSPFFSSPRARPPWPPWRRPPWPPRSAPGACAAWPRPRPTGW